MKTQHARVYLGAALSIALVGIGVNALVLQRERHPSPFFGRAPLPGSSSAPASAVTPAPQLASVDRDSSAMEVSPASPPPRPTDTVDTAPLHASDPITDLLRGEARVDAARLVLAAQIALAKLGYPVKPDGNEGVTTQQALRDFERGHGLPLSTELTPRLVKRLVLAARAAVR